MTKGRVFAGLLSVVFVLSVVIGLMPAARADALDEILEYAITVDVNDDGTLNMHYHFDWKVLDSTSEGPLSWIMVGIPNSNAISVDASSDAVSDIDLSYDGGNYVYVYFDREYYEGEIVSFDFTLVQDYMYEMNRFTDGETYYEFTPGWFDAAVDSLIVKWNSDKVKSVSPACLLREDGYYTWTASLSPGETYTVSVSYPNDAFAFDDSKSIEAFDDSFDYGYDGGYSAYDDVNDRSSVLGSVIGSVFPFLIIAFLVFVVRKLKAYSSTANFSAGTTKKVVTREKIVYHSSCPGCGAPRPEGKDNCEYCGTSFIKSKETVSEETVPEEMRQKTETGTYHYGSDPNTFLRVNVVHIPIVTARPGGSSRSGSSRSGSSRSGSCAHSSCACACASSCACACACACAGGGRAGCSTKDFYQTGLKLGMLKKDRGDTQ